jgi:adenylate kinase
VFHVWGIGGVGKSTLTDKLREQHATQADFAAVSFGMTEGIDDPIALMVELYSSRHFV